MLPRFKTIVAYDHRRGISAHGVIPWLHTSDDDRRSFRRQTLKGICIMGKATWESIPTKLDERLTIVVTRNDPPLLKSPDHIVSSLYQALKTAQTYQEQYPRGVFICGGEGLYREALFDYHYLLEEEIVNPLQKDYGCDKFYPLVSPSHSEQEYLRLLRKVFDQGRIKVDRTGVGTKALFGSMTMRFDLREGFPLLTTKKMSFKIVKAELEMMWNGRTNTKELEDQGIFIWKGNTTTSFLQEHHLPWAEGDMGPGYGFQWRHWGEKYVGANHDYQGIDQIKLLLETIRSNPASRRLILTAWNVADIDQMALPPCHCLFQCSVGFETIDGQSTPVWLDGQLYQRSGDMFLGVPYNIAFYSLLLHRLAQETGLIPRYFHHLLGDAHIYLNHLEQVKTQLARDPFPWPQLTAEETLIDYQSHSLLRAPMAI